MFDLCEKLILISKNMDLYVSCVYVMCSYVLGMIMYMGIYICDGSLTWAQKCIEFSMNEKVNFNKWDFCFIRFCIGGHLLKLYGLPFEIMRGPSLEGQSAAKCHIAGYLFYWEKMRKFENDWNNS